MRDCPIGANGLLAVLVTLVVAVGSFSLVSSAIMSEVGKVASSTPAVKTVYDRAAKLHVNEFTPFVRA